MRPFAVTASTPLLATIVACFLLTCSTVTPVFGQPRVQFPSPYQNAPPLVPVNPAFGAQGGRGAGFGTPQFGNPGFSTPQFGAPRATLGGTIQSFDPYALPGNIDPRSLAPVPPGPAFGVPGQTLPGQFGAAPQLTPPPQSVWQGRTPSLSVGPLPELPPDGAIVGPRPPNIGAPYGQPTGPAGANGDPYFRGSPYANGAPIGGRTPYGNGNGYGDAGGAGYGYGNDLGYSYGGARGGDQGLPYQRLFQDTGLRGSYFYGSDKDDLAMTEAGASTTAYFANFLGIPNGLRVTPGFAFHWTDGPQSPETSDVPARLYSAYLDFGLEPQFTPQFSAELSARVGVYSDFQSFNGDSIRLLGTAVGVYQASPEVAIKFGAAYIDRVKYKLLPAAGILWTPNPQTRWDIFFPAPKLSNYWTTINNKQVWWYLGGEYGGGSWSIEREDAPLKGADERLDINDIRIYAGVEMWNLNRYYGFAEMGYVFDRELVYFRVPGDSIHVDDTFMVRAGFSW